MSASSKTRTFKSMRDIGFELFLGSLSLQKTSILLRCLRILASQEFTFDCHSSLPTYRTKPTIISNYGEIYEIECIHLFVSCFSTVASFYYFSVHLAVGLAARLGLTSWIIETLAKRENVVQSQVEVQVDNCYYVTMTQGTTGELPFKFPRRPLYYLPLSPPSCLAQTQAQIPSLRP